MGRDVLVKTWGLERKIGNIIRARFPPSAILSGRHDQLAACVFTMSLKESQSESAHTEHLADSKTCTAQEGNAHEGNTHNTQGWFNWLTIGYSKS